MIVARCTAWAPTARLCAGGRGARSSSAVGAGCASSSRTRAGAAGDDQRRLLACALPGTTSSAPISAAKTKPAWRESARAIAALIDRDMNAASPLHRAGRFRRAARLLTGLRYPGAPGWAGGHVGLPAAGRQHRGRAQRRNQRCADLPGAVGSEDEIVALRAAALARCAGGARPRGRVAVTDGALGVPRRDRRAQPVAAARARRAAVSAPQTTPCASIASATFTKPATLAPST